MNHDTVKQRVFEPAKVKVGTFDSAWRRLGLAMRRRAMIRGAAAGALAGAMVSLALSMTRLGWFGVSLALVETTQWMAHLWLPVVVGLVAGGVTALLVNHKHAVMAAWADRHGDGRDSVRTMVATSGAFRDAAGPAAIAAVARAMTARVPIRGLSMCVLLAMSMLLASGLLTLARELDLNKSRSESGAPAPAPDPLLAASSLINDGASMLASLAGAKRLATWAEVAGMPALAAGANTAADLAKRLETGDVTQADAMAAAERIRELAAEHAGNPVVAGALEKLLDNPALLEVAQSYLADQTPETVAKLAGEGRVEELRQALEGVTPAGPAGDDAGTAPGTVRGRDSANQGVMGGLLDQLRGLLGGSPLARDVLSGRFSPDQGRAALEGSRELTKAADAISGGALRPGSSDTGPTDRPAAAGDRVTAKGLRLIDLPEIPVRVENTDSATQGSFPAGAPVQPTGTRVVTTGHSLAAKAADFSTRGHRLPREFRDAAATYFRPKADPAGE